MKFLSEYHKGEMAIGKGNNSNLVFECVQCKRRFGSEDERDFHQQETCHNVKERHQCPSCKKHFGNRHILQLHERVHNQPAENSPRDVAPRSGLPATQDERPASSLPAKKVIGLTKIRLEDCLRCDACSCIYIDKNDYNKHMKNFHRQNSPKKHNKQRKGCRSCCKHCNCQGDHTHQSIQKERGNNNLFHYNIKDRWTKMVSRRLSRVKKEIKSDPDSDSSGDTVDYSHLLSQVEVKIKTEPPDNAE